MSPSAIKTLRDDTRTLFYHGYDNYMTHAFPEDELRPLSCKPQTRNRKNPADIGVNDVLGNYTVTLVDSLSTLAILASDEDPVHASKALEEFQKGVERLVGLYGDGRVDKAGKKSCGSRACAFDLDSKVQVFETNIRGLGGLLSAHLFAVGELPIRGYAPEWKAVKAGRTGGGVEEVIEWPGGWRYDGQLLRLALDLGERLLPAFGTATGLPYPRVNLRHGIPFYRDSEAGVCRLDGTSTDPREITETCAAGAGSLVLEFTTLSRLTGDERFEKLAKRAFWAVWERRSGINLIGNGLDAESGTWTLPALSGIGAGIDSFYEYALKSSILLSHLSPPTTPNPNTTTLHPIDDHTTFLSIYDQTHAAINHHILRPTPPESHPYYAQSDFHTGAPRYTWLDNLSAYYPGLLTLAGHLPEAITSHALFTALWTRYHALPERWQPAGGGIIDPNFRHWAGRPEFIESTYYLYQATRDPFYLHVGEMALKDITRRCWTACGWADLGDVMKGLQRDRMESFFLGETAKYLYLLFQAEHPLNKGDRPVVFSTEGHPLVVPEKFRQSSQNRPLRGRKAEPASAAAAPPPQPICPLPPSPAPLTGSNIPLRPDYFHAAALASLHLQTPNNTVTLTSDSNTTFNTTTAATKSLLYPWTLPPSLTPQKGFSARIPTPVLSTLTFPNLNPHAGANSPEEKGLVPLGALQKTLNGVLITSLSNLRLSLVQDGFSSPGELGEEGVFRVSGVGGWMLGRDEKVLVSPRALEGVSPADPHFRRVRDLEMVDLVLDVPLAVVEGGEGEEDSVRVEGEVDEEDEEEVVVLMEDVTETDVGGFGDDNKDDDPADGIENLAKRTTPENLWHDLETLLSNLLAPLSPPSQPPSQPPHPRLSRTTIPAILPTGPGAAPLPASLNPTDADLSTLPLGNLPMTSIFYLKDTLCHNKLPVHIARNYNILVVSRGGCSFSEKLANVPSFPPAGESLKLVVVISFPEEGTGAELYTSPESRGRKMVTGREEEGLIRPLLDEPQRLPSGLERRHGIAMVMVEGSEGVVEGLKAAATGLGGFGGGNGEGEGFWEEVVVGRNGGGGRAGEKVAGGPGMGVKRRYWFESMGTVIGNLVMV
ncbi:hypothetical protein B0A50_08278 [Salinomyces thailandicus]|uniref:alpha-1,2-Mannosidase n=1 Tax=Salinomyces thailandicus TaxID=706561 RepID=A0A4V5N382_9PEZI|nr:hypothetical protein B0A50_08278 [Salinomyces thailandica]